MVESPGYTVPEDSGLAWIQGFAPVSETVLDKEGGHWRSRTDPPPRPVPTSAATPAVVPVTEGPAVSTMPPTSDDTRFKPGTGGVRRAQVFVVESTGGSISTPLCQATADISPDLSREGPFDASEVIPEPGQSPLVLNSIPGCQFRMTSYDDRDNDLNPEYGIHLHDPLMMEYMGAPESARLLGRSPEYWLEHMGRDRGGSGGSSPIAPRCQPYHDKRTGHVPVCDQPKQNSVGGHEISLRHAAVSDRRSQLCDTRSQSSTCGTLHGRHGPVAPYQCSSVSGTHLVVFMQLLHDLR